MSKCASIKSVVPVVIDRIRKRIVGRFLFERIPGIRYDLGNPSARSMTQQSMAKDCDINCIVAKARKTGTLPAGVRQPMFGDFSAGSTYHDVKCRVARAEAEFLLLPADVRYRFHNDVGEFLDFASDVANASELRSMLPREAEEPLQGAPKEPTGDSGSNAVSDVPMGPPKGVVSATGGKGA